MTAARLALLALGVLMLHAWLLGGLAPQWMSVAKPVAPAAPVVAAQAVAVRTLDRGPAAGTRVPADSGARVLAAQAREAGSAATDAAPAPVETQRRPPRSKHLPAGSLPAPHTQMSDSVLPSPSQSPRSPRPSTSPPTPATIDASPADVPVYATRLPPAFAYAYTLRSGASTGDVEWRWQQGEERYETSLEARSGDTRRFALKSIGGFDAAGIAPLRHTDRRRGRGTLAVNFQRDLGAITFSGPQIEHRLAPGVQDRLSWMLQLAAIAAADPARVEAGGGVTMRVVGVRGEADVWTFEPVATETIELPGGATPTHHLLRSPERPYDTRAEVWLDPARDFLPVRVRLSHGAESTALEWQGVIPAAPSDRARP
jgi:hypothetical protein